jgi:hypothetical protein
MAIAACNIHSKWNITCTANITTPSPPTTSTSVDQNVSSAFKTPATKEEKLTRLQIKKSKLIPTKMAL